MSDDFVRSIVAGLVTGGASATTTFLTVFRGVKGQVTNLESKVGSPLDPKSGLYLSLANLEDTVRRLKRDIDGWEDHPPDWAKRLINRVKVNASSDLSTLVDIESRVDARLRSFHDRLSNLEDDHESVPSGFSREEFLAETKHRALEISEMRKEIAVVNGLLRGILLALGHNTETR
jgi:hypothetical protein